jgi:hypothetical protein
VPAAIPNRRGRKWLDPDKLFPKPDELDPEQFAGAGHDELIPGGLELLPELTL